MSKRRNKDDVKVLTVKHLKEKEEFEKNMTIKREKKKESMTRKLLEHERLVFRRLLYCFYIR